MEKTLIIDGKPVRFRATAGTLIRYKSQFGREFLADCEALTHCIQTVPDVDKDGNPTMKQTIDVSAFNMDVVFGVLWAMAKTADASVPDMLTWLDTFEEFQAIGIFAEVMPMLSGFLRVDPKNA